MLARRVLAGNDLYQVAFKINLFQLPHSWDHTEPDKSGNCHNEQTVRGQSVDFWRKYGKIINV
jgi:hypothetical protein